MPNVVAELRECWCSFSVEAPVKRKYSTSFEVRPSRLGAPSFIACEIKKTIDSELRLVAALRHPARERGGPFPSIAVADPLLDERRELLALTRV
jgi:hypothetical protein